MANLHFRRFHVQNTKLTILGKEQKISSSPHQRHSVLPDETSRLCQTKQVSLPSRNSLKVLKTKSTYAGENSLSPLDQRKRILPKQTMSLENDQIHLCRRRHLIFVNRGSQFCQRRYIIPISQRLFKRIKLWCSSTTIAGSYCGAVLL